MGKLRIGPHDASRIALLTCSYRTCRINACETTRISRQWDSREKKKSQKRYAKIRTISKFYSLIVRRGKRLEDREESMTIDHRNFRTFLVYVSIYEVDWKRGHSPIDRSMLTRATFLFASKHALPSKSYQRERYFQNDVSLKKVFVILLLYDFYYTIELCASSKYRIVNIDDNLHRVNQRKYVYAFGCTNSVDFTSPPLSLLLFSVCLRPKSSLEGQSKEGG